MNKEIKVDKKNVEIIIERSERFGPFVIASAIFKDKNISRKKGYGISKCSRSDRFDSKHGFARAEGRAKKALFKKIKNGKSKIHEIYLG